LHFVALHLTLRQHGLSATDLQCHGMKLHEIIGRDVVLDRKQWRGVC